MSEQLNWAVRRAQGLWWQCRETVPEEQFMNIISKDLRLVWKAGGLAMQRRIRAKLTVTLRMRRFSESQINLILSDIDGVTVPKRT